MRVNEMLIASVVGRPATVALPAMVPSGKRGLARARRPASGRPALGQRIILRWTSAIISNSIGEWALTLLGLALLPAPLSTCSLRGSASLRLLQPARPLRRASGAAPLARARAAPFESARALRRLSTRACVRLRLWPEARRRRQTRIRASCASRATCSHGNSRYRPAPARAHCRLQGNRRGLPAMR